MYFLRGNLPWQDLKADNKLDAEKKLKKYAIDNVASQYHNYMFVNVFETL